MQTCLPLITLTFCLLLAAPAGAEESLVAEGAKVELLADGLKFTEGPALAPDGSVYFTDIPNNHILHWDVKAKKLSTFMEDSQGANGLYFGHDKKLYACQGRARRLVAIDIDTKEVKLIADAYNGKKFNRPNDLWIDPTGGIYFTDPGYGMPKEEAEQGGEHVYYVTADRSAVHRVIDDYKRPNGIIGTADGKTLYVTDRDGKQTYRYAIQPDGALADKKLFCEEGSDGMTLDEKGNVYLTPPASAVHIYSPEGKLIEKIATPKPPANVTFAGEDRMTLFITARDSLYAVKMKVKGQ